MFLIKFLLYGAIISTILGEFGHFPFGSSSGAVSATDLFIALVFIFSLIWIVSTKMKIIFPKPFTWLALFWLTGLLSLLWSLKIFTPTQVSLGGLYLLRFIFYSLVFLVSFNLGKGGVLKVKELAHLWILLGLVLVILGFIQLILVPNFSTPPFFLTDYGFDPHTGRLTSTFLDPNFAGAFFVLTLFLLLAESEFKKIQLTLLVSIVLVGILLTLSRSSYLMLVISFSTFLCLSSSFLSWKNFTVKKKIGLSMLVLIVLAALFLFFPKFNERIISSFTVDKSAAERLISWRNGLLVFQSSPVVGVGFNNFRFAQEKFNLIKPYSDNGGHAGGGVDSSLILVLATTGVVGLSFFLIFLSALFQSLLRSRMPISIALISVLFGLLVNSQFINSLFFPPIMLGYFSLSGVVLSKES